MSKEYNRRLPQTGDTYRHFKGMFINVCGIATNTETEEELVIYTHNDNMWARPLDMFLSEVDHSKYPDVKQKYRLERVLPYNITESFEFKQYMEEYRNIPPFTDYSDNDLEKYILEHFYL